MSALDLTSVPMDQQVRIYLLRNIAKELRTNGGGAYDDDSSIVTITVTPQPEWEINDTLTPTFCGGLQDYYITEGTDASGTKRWSVTAAWMNDDVIDPYVRFIDWVKQELREATDGEQDAAVEAQMAQWLISGDI